MRVIEKLWRADLTEPPDADGKYFVQVKVRFIKGGANLWTIYKFKWPISASYDGYHRLESRFPIIAGEVRRAIHDYLANTPEGGSSSPGS
jgi:hypothetical protein